MYDYKAYGGKKRCRPQYDDDEDDEEPPPPEVKQETGVKTEDGAPVAKKQPQNCDQNHVQGKRFVLLSSKSSTGERTTWPLSEDVLCRIPKYAAKLSEVKSHANGDKPLAIFDDHMGGRNRSCMLAILDYLSAGYIEPIKRDSGLSCRESLAELLWLHRTAKSLEIGSLMHKISVLISEQQHLAPVIFVELAAHCCDEQYGMDISSESVIGWWIRKQFEMHMAELKAGGHIDRITRKGGELAVILGEVLVEIFVRNGR